VSPRLINGETFVGDLGVERRRKELGRLVRVRHRQSDVVDAVHIVTDRVLGSPENVGA
jgi:hypothetical protein